MEIGSLQKYKLQYIASEDLFNKSQEEDSQSEIYQKQLHSILPINKENQRQISLYMNYEYNYVLFTQLLSLSNKPNIIIYKSIYLSEEQKVAIQMERGVKYDAKINWYGPISKQEVSAQQKFKFIVDVCRGLMDLSELKVLHLDVKPRNIVKVRETFKIIDFDRALLVGVTDTYPKFRNYLRGSELQFIKKELFENTKQIISKQLKLDILKQCNILMFITQYSFIREILENNSIEKEKIVEKIISQLQTKINEIHVRQFGQLLKDLFDEVQIKQIQKYRLAIYQKKECKIIKTPFETLLQQLSNSTKFERCSLQMFYSQFTFTDYSVQELKVINYRIRENSLINSIHRKKAAQFWKDVITIKQGKQLSQQTQKFDRINNPMRYYSTIFQEIAKKEIRESLKGISTMNNGKNLYCKEMKFSDYFPELIVKINYSQTFDQNSEILFCQTNNKILQNRIKRYSSAIKLNKKYQQTINQNFGQNYFISKLLLIKYISTKISAQNILTPKGFNFDPNNNTLNIQYQQSQSNKECWQRVNDDQKIGSLWTQGFGNIVKFIKDLTNATLELQKYGLFHPKISFQNIIDSYLDESGGIKKRLYKLINLEECYFLSSNYTLSEEEEVLLNSFKMILFHLFNPQSCIKTNGIFDSLQDFCSQLHQLSENYQKMDFNYIICSEDLIQIKKSKVYFQKLCQLYSKIHAKQLGQIFKNIIQHYRLKKGNGNNIFVQNFLKEQITFVPAYWQKKIEQIFKIVTNLIHPNIKNRIQVKSFYEQFNDIFPTCEVTDHKSQLNLYYFIQNEKKEFLCNQCIKSFKKENVELFCIDHSRPIRYSEPFKKNIQFFGKSYYCEECCDSLPPNTKVNLIDSTNLEECKYICMDIDCNSYLISEQNRKQNHSNHQTKTFSEFQHFYKSSSTQNSNQTIESCRQQGNSCISQFRKIALSYTSNITNLFRQITQFKAQGIRQCERLEKILNPTNRDIKRNIQSESQFWNILKTMHYIYEKSREEQYNMVTIEGFVEYCNSKFSELASSAHEKIKQILSNLYQQLRSQIFSKEIHKTVQKFVHEKYGQIINNEKNQQIKPYNFQIIPDKYNKVVKKVNINRNQLDFYNYFEQRNQQRIQFQNYCKERCEVYKKWSQWVNADKQNLSLIEKKNKMGDLKENKKENKKYNRKENKSRKVNFFDQYELCSNELRKSINQEKKALQILKTNRSNSDSQQLNILALERKKWLLQAQRQSIDQIMGDLQKIDKIEKQIKNQSNQLKAKKKDEIENIKKIIIEELKQNIDVIPSQLRAFNIQIMYNRQCFSQKQIEKICEFSNLEQFKFNQQQNPIFMKTFDRQYSLTVQMLQELTQKCDQLNKIQFKGGFVQVLPCLDYLLQQKNTPQFVFYANTETVISKKQQIQKLNGYLQTIKFSFPCINIGIRNNIDENEKKMIIEIISKVQQIKLQIYGPLKKNKYTLQILKYITEQQNLKVTSLLLKRFKMSNHDLILREIAKKGRIQKVTLVNCVNYNSSFLDYCCNYLKIVTIKGSLKIQVPIQFMAALFRCTGLESIALNNIIFKPTNLSLKDLKYLSSLMLQYCPEINSTFLSSLHAQSIKSMKYLMIRYCLKVTQDFVDCLKQMEQLKYLDLNYSKISVQSLLKLQADKLQVLYIRLARPVNEQFLVKMSEKWPNIIGLALPQFTTVSSSTILKCFKNLKNIIIFRNQFSMEDKYEFLDKKTNVEEYN